MPTLREQTPELIEALSTHNVSTAKVANIFGT